jgi:hypothetical protein
VRKGSDVQDELAQLDETCPTANNDAPMTCASCAGYSCIPATLNTMDAKVAFDPFGNLVWIGLGDSLGSPLQAVQRYTATSH